MPTAPLRAANVTDTGPGNFPDINNSATVDYVEVTNGATIGNVTNASAGTTTSGFAFSSGAPFFLVGLAGLGVDNSTVTGAVTNNGQIQYSASSGTFHGIYLGGATQVEGNVVNNGAISATGALITAAGISLDAGTTVSGDVSNTGSIILTTTDGSGTFGVDGILSLGTVTGNLFNKGIIDVTAGAGGEALGVVNGGAAGSLVNIGTINLHAQGAGAFLVGIYSGIAISGNMINKGSINAAVGDGVSVIGEYNDASLGGNLINQGKITIASGNGGGVIGVVSDGLITGELINSGTITTSAGASGQAAGIENSSSTILGGIINTGTVTATAGAGGTAFSVLSFGSTVSIAQNAGALNGDVGLSGTDTFDINGGFVNGSVIGNHDGNVSLADTVNLNGGQLVLSPTNFVSNLHNFTIGTNGVLIENVTTTTAPNIAADNINLGGTLQVVPTGSGWTANTVYNYTNAIAANDALTGAFSNVTTSGLFTTELVPDAAHSLDLVVTENATPTSSPGLNNFLANLVNTGGSSNATAQALTTNLETLPSAQFQHAITQLTAPGVAQNITAVRDVSNNFSSMVQQRLAAGGGYDTSDVSSIGLSNNGAEINVSPNRPLLALAPMPDGGTWVRAFGGFASAGAQSSVPGFDENRAGVIFGIDKKFTPDWTFGVAGQYAHTNLTFDDDFGSSSADSYNGMIYGGWHQGPIYANSTLGFGWNNYNSSRDVLIGGFTSNPSGSFSGQDYSFAAETGYAVPIQDWTLTPYAGFDYTRTHTDSFTESGDGVTNLMVQSNDSNSFVTTLGMRAGTTVRLKDYGDFLPEIHIGWQHEAMDQSQTFNAAFISSPGDVFAVTGPQYGRNSALVGTSITHNLADDLAVFLTYDAKVNGDYAEHALSGGVRFTF